MDITKYISENRESAFLLGDYITYRKQLTRRLLTLRKRLGRATSKNAKYAPKAPITSEEVGKNIEVLHLELLTTERAWAQAMAMKASHSEDNADQRITGSTKRHIISKLHKAAKYAQGMVELLSDRANSKASETDILEAQAYSYTMAGAREFEKQSEGVKSADALPDRWVACLTSYAAARVIYNSLFRSTKRDVFKDILAGTTDPSIRYAAYQHRIPRTVSVSSVSKQFFPRDNQELVKVVENLDPLALQEEETASSEVDQAQARKVPNTVTWRTRTANIVDAAIGQALSALDSASLELNSYLQTTVSSKEKGNAYDYVLLASQDAADATRQAIDELEKEGVAEGDARMQDLRVTSLAVNYDLVAWRVGRNRVLIGADDGITFSSVAPQKPRQTRKAGKEWVERPEPTGRKLARLRERVALYDAILQSIDSIKDLRGAIRDAEFMAELDGQRAYFQALKCLNISHSHAFLSAPKQALALSNRALALSAQAVSAPRPGGLSPSDAPKLGVSIDQAKALHTHLGNLTSHYRGLVALSQLPNRSDTPSKSQTGSFAPIVEKLGEYPASGTVDLMNLVTWPPKVKPVPVKPLFFDVAWNYIDYAGRAQQTAAREPEVQQALTEEEEKGTKPAKKGWFGFGR